MHGEPSRPAALLLQPAARRVCTEELHLHTESVHPSILPLVFQPPIPPSSLLSSIHQYLHLTVIHQSLHPAIIHSFTPSSTPHPSTLQSLINPFFTHPSLHPAVIHSFIQPSSILPSIYPFIRPSIHPSTHTHLCVESSASSSDHNGQRGPMSRTSAWEDTLSGRDASETPGSPSEPSESLSCWSHQWKRF